MTSNCSLCSQRRFWCMSKTVYLIVLCCAQFKRFCVPVYKCVRLTGSYKAARSDVPSSSIREFAKEINCIFVFLWRTKDIFRFRCCFFLPWLFFPFVSMQRFLFFISILDADCRKRGEQRQSAEVPLLVVCWNSVCFVIVLWYYLHSFPIFLPLFLCTDVCFRRAV